MFLIVLTILVVLVLKWCWDHYKFLQLRDKLGLPGPPVRFPLGCVNYIVDDLVKYGLNKSALQWSRMVDKYGTTIGLYMAKQLYISTTDPEIINEVFIKQFSKFINRPTQHIEHSYPLNDSLLNITKYGVGNGYGWKDVRSVASPIFTTGKLKTMYPVMAERVKVFVESLRSKADGGPVEVYDDLQALTLDVIGRCAFGMQTDCINNRSDIFYTNSRAFFATLTIEDNPLLLLGYLFPKIAQMLKPFSELGRTQKALLVGLDEVVEQRRKAFESGEVARKDLISLLMEQNEERIRNTNKIPLRDSTIVANCFAFLIAGYETTSTALSFTLYCLAKHPEVQETLLEEINETFPSDESVSYENMMKMSYLDAVCKEALRRYPPVVIFSSRECVEDCVIKGIPIRKSMCVEAPVHGTHWNSEIWPEPMKFDPNRFLTYDGQVDPLKWFPFGIGPRNCVGMRFADMEMKSTIIAMVRAFRLELSDELKNKELKVRTLDVLLRPINGVHLKLHPR